MRKNIKDLLERIRSGKYTAEEEAQAKYWLHQLHKQDDFPVPTEQLSEISEAMWEKTFQQTIGKKQARRIGFLWPKVAAAVVLLLVATGVYFYWLDKPAAAPKVSQTYANDAMPGGNKATLTLADGQKISLTDATNGTLLEQAGIKITKTADGAVVYDVVASSGSGGSEAYNRIETPVGGQYQINLPDGTKVWLNALSTLKFPVDFGPSQRSVELIGEAYFEVEHDQSRPFIVKTDRQELKVLGTSFNINSYADEMDTKTTLLSGSVQLVPLGSQGSDAFLLKPGQMAALRDEQFQVKAVDADEAIAWKQGVFLFSDDPLEEIMQKLRRWYGVEVRFKDPTVAQERFSGSVSRFANISKVLNKLEKVGGVKFSINQRQVEVMRD